MSRTLAILTAEGFTSTIRERDDKAVIYIADGDIDADGANGQNGKQAAYMVNDKGSELLANGGMGMRNGRVVFTKSWGPDIAVVGADGQPLVINGVVITKTAYRFPGRAVNDPAAYVDSETVPYIVVPPIVVTAVAGVVKGCQAYATYRGRREPAMMGDVGPRTKNGELSIELARRLGIPHSPRNGGLDTAEITYELWPGKAAVIGGVTYPLVRS